MFLIHHDQADIAEGQEQRRPGADHQPRLPFRRADPDAAALGAGQGGVPFGGSAAKTPLHPFDEGRGESDLWEEDQRLPPGGEAFGDGFEVDLSLSGSGDALEEMGGEVAGGHGPAQRLRRRRLRVGQFYRLRRRIETGEGGRAWPLLRNQRARLGEALDDGGGDTRRLSQFAGRQGRARHILQRRHDPFPRRGHPRRAVFAKAPELARAGRFGEVGRAGGEAEHLTKRRQRIFARLRQKFPHRRGHRRQVEPGEHGFDLRRVGVARPRPPDHADHRVRPDLHHHQIAGTERFARAVVIGAVDRQRRQDGNQIAGAEADIRVFRHAFSRGGGFPHGLMCAANFAVA